MQQNIRVDINHRAKKKPYIYPAVVNTVMKALKLEGAIDTPEIYFDPETNIFSIS